MQTQLIIHQRRRGSGENLNSELTHDQFEIVMIAAAVIIASASIAEAEAEQIRQRHKPARRHVDLAIA
jgi:hypothetical protein